MLDRLPFLFLAGAVIFVFFGLSYSSHRFRLPSVLLYIIFGLVVAGKFAGNHALYLAAEIGIVVLFFVLGLEFPLGRMLVISRRISLAGGSMSCST